MALFHFKSQSYPWQIWGKSQPYLIPISGNPTLWNVLGIYQAYRIHNTYQERIWRKSHENCMEISDKYLANPIHISYVLYANLRHMSGKYFGVGSKNFPLKNFSHEFNLGGGRVRIESRNFRGITDWIGQKWGEATSGALRAPISYTPPPLGVCDTFPNSNYLN